MPNSKELIRPFEDWRLQIPSKEFEYLDVTFPGADVDTRFPHSLQLDDPEELRWIDISPGTVYTGGVDTVAKVYRSNSPTRQKFTSTTISLRSTVAGYSTRLLLFVERS